MVLASTTAQPPLHGGRRPRRQAVPNGNQRPIDAHVHEEGLAPDEPPSPRDAQRELDHAQIRTLGQVPILHATPIGDQRRPSIHSVHEEGLEPPRLAAPEPKSGASANSATRARTAQYATVDPKSTPCGPCPASWRAHQQVRGPATRRAASKMLPGHVVCCQAPELATPRAP
jgi:hypothetical protein